ncbi:MAG: hypothetical protein IJI68_13785 [Eggerthellaceae bacterium]|nr:hypothetical protein [Eggerthellaceae bacterium]
MRQYDFEQWMRRSGLEEGTIQSRVSNCKWIEENVGCDLDDSYDRDGGARVFKALEYHRGVRHPLEYLIDGDPYTNLSMYRSTANLYFEFCSGREHVKRKTRGRSMSSPVKVSYMPGYGPNGKTVEAENADEKPQPPADMEEISELWADYMRATNRIAAALGRSANIVGEYAERLVSEYYGGELLTASNKSADIRLRDGRLIQVKSRVPRQTSTTSLSPIRSWDFDLLVVVLFNPDGSIMEALEMTADVAKSHARRDEHQNSDLLVTTDEFIHDPAAKDIHCELSALMASKRGEAKL